MITSRLLRLGIVIVSMVPITACQQGATVGPYPSSRITATPTATAATPTASPTGGVLPTATPTATASAGVTATPTASATATATASAGAAGQLTISPNPLNFGVLAVLGSTQTATISQTNYSGPFTLPANPVTCSNGILNIPVTATISGSTLTIALGILGVTGSCVVTVDGGNGMSGTETVNLAVPLGTPPSAGPFVFNPDPITFNVLDGVTGSTATTTVSEAGYNGAFTLPATPVSCPFNLVPLTQVTATISGSTVTVTTGALNASLLGSCDVTVDDANGHSGAFAVNFQLL